MTAHVRLDAAPQPLTHLADPRRPDSPLAPIRVACERLADPASPTPTTEHLAVHAKLFAWMTGQAVRREMKALRGALRDEAIADADAARRAAARRALEEHACGALDRIRSSLGALRRLREQVRPFEPVCHGSLPEALA